MHGDEPTVPNLRRYDAYDAGASDETPNWPIASGRTPRASTNSTTANAMLLGASLFANVILLVLVVLLGLLLIVRGGFFAPGGSSAQSSPGASTANSALGSPSATSGTPSPTAVTAASGGLQVAPTTVQLGCENGQQTQFVVLANRGAEPVQWQADFSLPEDQAGATISPDHGQLRAGASIVLQLRNRSHDAGHQGVIRFAATAHDAGTPASLSYTTTACD